MSTEIIKIIQGSNLEKITGDYIIEKMQPFYDQAAKWREKADLIVVNDVTQIEAMEQAREMRLAIAKVRTSSDKMRQALKADSIKYGKVVQEVYNQIETLTKDIEANLYVKEKFKEIQEQKIKNELKAKREKEIEVYKEFIPLGVNLADMNEEAYYRFLEGLKVQLKMKIELARQQEAERIERDRLDKIEKYRSSKLLEIGMLWDGTNYIYPNIHFEQWDNVLSLDDSQFNGYLIGITNQINEQIRLNKEIEVKQRIEHNRMQKEKEEVAAQLKAIQDEKGKLEKELNDKKIEEQKKKEHEEQIRQLAFKGTDKDKLYNYANDLDNIPFPDLKGIEAVNIMKEFYPKLQQALNIIYNFCKKTNGNSQH
jgi:hypothetical protein